MWPFLLRQTGFFREAKLAFCLGFLSGRRGLAAAASGPRWEEIKLFISFCLFIYLFCLGCLFWPPAWRLFGRPMSQTRAKPPHTLSGLVWGPHFRPSDDSLGCQFGAPSKQPAWKQTPKRLFFHLFLFPARSTGARSAAVRWRATCHACIWAQVAKCTASRLELESCELSEPSGPLSAPAP